VRLLIGTESEQAAVIRTAHEMHQADQRTALLVLLGITGAPSFKPRPSTILVPAMPAGVIAAIPSLEEFGIASRLASTAGQAGCYDGSVLELAEQWLEALEPPLRTQVEITVVGDAALLGAVQEIGRKFAVPVGVSSGTSQP
jgi:dihydroorotate dehydrogenase electron transfer subunit